MDMLESFMLLAVNPDRETLYNSRTFLRYGIAGMAIAALVEQGKLELEGGRVLARDMTSSGDVMLDKICEAISRKTYPRKLNSWISSLTHTVRNMDHRILRGLEDNGILRIDQKRFLGLIPYKRYVVTDPGKRDSLVRRCREIIMTGNRTPDKEDMVLISAAVACEFLARSFSREERSSVRGQLRQIKKGEYFETDDETLKLLVKSIVRAIAATRAAAAAAAG